MLVSVTERQIPTFDGGQSSAVSKSIFVDSDPPPLRQIILKKMRHLFLKITILLQPIS
jgi:hypothetical protein